MNAVEYNMKKVVYFKRKPNRSPGLGIVSITRLFSWFHGLSYLFGLINLYSDVSSSNIQKT